MWGGCAPARYKVAGAHNAVDALPVRQRDTGVDEGDKANPKGKELRRGQ